MRSSNLFSSDLGRANSCYTSVHDDHLVMPLESGRPAPVAAAFVHAQFRSLVLTSEYPCVGGRAALNQNTYRFGLYPSMGTMKATAGLGHDLLTFINEQPAMDTNFTTFIACFTAPNPRNERHFERLLWHQLQKLHDNDPDAWDSTVEMDPENRNFSFSFGGRAFFIVGLHAGSSRWSRRFAWPTLIFNAHQQFMVLWATGQFERFREVIRERDCAIQGTINPSLRDFGELSEARQYSGRYVEENWRCPLHVAAEGR